jgi:PTS system glucose-specific IIC component
MYLRAKNKVKVAGMLTTAAITSFLTGITEPIEFSFIFVAPPLYLFHVVGGFISGLLTNLFDIRIGYTFSASAIDYVLSLSNLGNPMMFWLVVGPIMAVLYFTVFYFTIPLFNFETPGRGSDAEDSAADEPVSKDQRAADVLAALGGSENLESVDACITRLRLEVLDNSVLDEKELKRLGASGVMKSGSSVQVVFGPESDALKDKIKSLM